MINWRRIDDHPDTEVEYYGRYPDETEREVIPEGRWLFWWTNGDIEACSTDEPLPVGVWPGRMVERPTHWAEFNEPEAVDEWSLDLNAYDIMVAILKS